MSAGSCKTSRAHAILVLGFAALAVGPCAQAADAAQRVVRDAVTGELRAPTAEEFQALEAAEANARRGAPAAPREAPVARRSVHGAHGFRVGDRFMTYSVIKRNADGTTSLVCVTGEDAADRVLRAPQAATSTAAHKEADHAR